jgi:TolB-like protein
MKRTICFVLMLFVVSCSTTSVVIDDYGSSNPEVAVLTLDGELGSRAAELLSKELAANGVLVAERSERIANLALDTDLSASSPSSIRSLGDYGEQLGVNYLLTGTVSTDRGPLYSFAHVFITVRLIDIDNGQTRWVGEYGNSLWSTAISTEGDLKRGVRHLVKEFISSGAAEIVK